jgi:AcrR family transcriptional regulator
VNIDRVAKGAGTTRAAIYRRAKTRGELVVALLVSRFGIDPAPDSGDLREDLRLIQELQRHFFTDPMVQAALAGVLSDLREDSELGEAFYKRFMEPRRRSVAAMLTRASERGEIAPPPRPGIISDLLTGPLLLHVALPPIGPIDDALVNATIEAALTACGAVEHAAEPSPGRTSQR